MLLWTKGAVVKVMRGIVMSYSCRSDQCDFNNQSQFGVGVGLTGGALWRLREINVMPAAIANLG
jgi:hypothetical protein